MSSSKFIFAILACLLCVGAMAQGVTLPEVERTVLDNGVVLILHEKDDVPLIGIEASIRGGAVSDPAGLGPESLKRGRGNAIQPNLPRPLMPSAAR